MKGVAEMLKSRNRRHTFELVAWILFAVIFFMNINSVMGGIGQFTSNAPQSTQNVFSNIADVGDGMQDVAENGILQSAISAVMGTIGVSSATTETAEAVVVEAPTDTSTGNIGEWIEGIGGWLVGLWSFGESAQATEETGLPANLTVASEDFKHLSRPVVTYVPTKADDNKEVHTVSNEM